MNSKCNEFYCIILNFRKEKSKMRFYFFVINFKYQEKCFGEFWELIDVDF